MAAQGPDEPAGGERKRLYCHAYADLYDPAARPTILALCREFLAAARITPTELLHVPAHQQRFVHVGHLYQEVVQRVAVRQIEGLATPVQTRMRELYGFVEEAMRAAAARLAETPPHRLQPTSFVSFVAGLADAGPFDRDFAVHAALAAHLAEAQTWPEKIAAALDFARCAAGRPAAFAYLDRLVGEMVRIGAVTKTIFPDAASSGALAEAIVDLLGGKGPAGDAQATPQAILAQIGRVEPMPETRAALIGLLRAVLSRPSPLVSGQAPEELAAHLRLIRRMREARRDFGGERTAEAIARRLDRLIGPDGIQQILKPHRQPADRLLSLLELHAALAGIRVQAKVAGYAEHVMRHERAIEVLLREPTPWLQKLRSLARLYGAAANAGFPAQIRIRYSGPIEQAHAALVRQSRLFERIDQSGTPADRALKLIELCGADILIPGINLQAAHQRLRHCLQDGGFLPAYLGAGDDGARERKLAALNRKLSSIGLSEALPLV